MVAASRDVVVIGILSAITFPRIAMGDVRNTANDFRRLIGTNSWRAWLALRNLPNRQVSRLLPSIQSQTDRKKSAIDTIVKLDQAGSVQFVSSERSAGNTALANTRRASGENSAAEFSSATERDRLDQKRAPSRRTEKMIELRQQERDHLLLPNCNTDYEVRPRPGYTAASVTI